MKRRERCIRWMSALPNQLSYLIFHRFLLLCCCSSLYFLLVLFVFLSLSLRWQRLGETGRKTWYSQNIAFHCLSNVHRHDQNHAIYLHTDAGYDPCDPITGFSFGTGASCVTACNKTFKKGKKALSIYQPINSATVMAGNFQEEYQHGVPSFNDWPDILEKNSWESNHIHDIIWADGHKGELQDEFYWTMNPGNNENIHGDLLGASVENGKHKGIMMIMLVRSVFIPDPDSDMDQNSCERGEWMRANPTQVLVGRLKTKGCIYIYL